MIKLRKLIVVTGMVASSLSGSAYAASQGSLGTTSTGSASISITKPIQAQISDISDMVAGDWTAGDGAVSMNSNVCVYSSTGNYKVTATGSGAGKAFTLSSGGNTVPYTVTWNAGGAGGLGNTGTTLTTNNQSTGFGNASTASVNCNGGGSGNDTARVIVGITSSSMQSAIASNTPYTGTLTMLVTPY